MAMHILWTLLTALLTNNISPDIDHRALVLQAAYPDAIDSITNGYIIFANQGSLPLYAADAEDNAIDPLNPDIASTVVYHYPLSVSPDYRPGADPGRKRNQAFLMELYGKSPEEIRENLTQVIWLKDHQAQIIEMNTKQGAADALQAVSNELNEHPELWPYLSPASGGFNWRFIAGTNRLSAHSFGIAIDINVAYSHYWKWDYPQASETEPLSLDVYRNSIPYEIVEVFEKHGFIWGGKWTHYDSMHFEYRPEIILAATYKMQKEEIIAKLKSKNSQLIEFINQSVHSFSSF